ncbi:MAG: hypothetical protein WEE64_01165 [Dehalococcoidia bacterium]
MSNEDLPPAVISWVLHVFQQCNARIAEKLVNNPNVPEESLDLTWIEHLSRYSSPIALGNSWFAKIQAHYLGGMRHFYRWEIADIGVLVFLKRAGEMRRSKVGLLQSKRLYPASQKVAEETLVDYETGFARLADPEDWSRSIATETMFEFNDECRYGALLAASNQVKAIKQYERKSRLQVYYQLYNPPALPLTRFVPSEHITINEVGIGTRIVAASQVHKTLATLKSGESPSLKLLAKTAGGVESLGWPLERFVLEMLECREGSSFAALDDDRIQSMFFRRTGAIAAAIAITIEGPQ